MFRIAVGFHGLHRVGSTYGCQNRNRYNINQQMEWFSFRARIVQTVDLIENTGFDHFSW